MVTHGFCASISLFSYSRVYTIHLHLFLFAVVHTNSRYSPLRFSRPRLILLVRGRGTEYLRDTETDSLQLYWPPPLSSIYSSSSFVVRLSVGLSELSLRLTAAPTANQSAALPAPVIGFPRFSQLFLKSHATLFFPVLAPLSFSSDRVARACCLEESMSRSRNNRLANEKRLHR